MPAIIDITTLSIAQLAVDASTGQAFADSLVGLPLEEADYDDLRIFLRRGDEDIRQALASIDPSMASDFRLMQMGLDMLVENGEREQAAVMKARWAAVFRPMNGEWERVQRRFRMSGAIAPSAVRPAVIPILTFEGRKVRNLVLRLTDVLPDLVRLYSHFLENAATPEVFANNLADVLIDLDRKTDLLFKGDRYDYQRLVEMERWFEKEGLIATVAAIAVTFPNRYDQLRQTVAQNSLAETPAELIRGIRWRIQQAKQALAQR